MPPCLACWTLSTATILDGTEQSDNLNWTFDSDGETFNYLEKGEQLILTYTVTATDDDANPFSGSRDVTITITGTNDQSIITGGNDTASLVETDTTLSTNGSFQVEDLDTKDTVRAEVTSVGLSGTFITDSGSTLPTTLSDNNKAALIAMLDLSRADLGSGSDSSSDHIIESVDADSAPNGPSTINWEFTSEASGDGAFDFLQQDETLILTYAVTLTDDSGATGSDESEDSVTYITITITGTNEAPVITDGEDSTGLSETNTTISDTGDMTVTDIDLTDTVDVAAQSVVISGGSFAGTVPSALTDNTNQSLLSMLSFSPVAGTKLNANPSAGSAFDWTFQSGDSGTREIQKASTLSLNQANRTFSFYSGTRSQEGNVAIQSGNSGFASATAMATAFQNHANYSNLPYTISADQTDTALILTFKDSGDVALRKLEKHGDHATDLSVVQNGESAVSTSDHHFDFLADGETLELTYTVQVTDPSSTRVTLSGDFNAGDSVTTTINSQEVSYTITANDLTANGDGSGGVATTAQALDHIATNLAAAINADGTLSGVISASADGEVINLSNVSGSAPIGLATTVTPLPSGWEQLGTDIDGQAGGDELGLSVSISGDGTTLAVGAPFNDAAGGNAGQARIYRWDGTAWQQLGTDILGAAADDQTGWSVSLSDDGNTVAISGKQHDSYAGHTRIYRWDGSAWQQLGADVEGEGDYNYSGYATSLSADGNTLATSSINHGGNRGRTRVFSWNNSAWVQVGDNIDGENGDDASGFSISLSSDGTTIAIGATQNDGNGNGNSGHTRIFDLVSGSWVQRGSDLDGENAGDQSGHSVSLAADGNTVAIGSWINSNSRGHTRIYRWLNGAWAQVGDDIDGENSGDQSGFSVSLADDGNTVAIGARYNTGAAGGLSGHTRIYRLNGAGTSWEQLSIDIDGEASGDQSGSSISLR